MSTIKGSDGMVVRPTHGLNERWLDNPANHMFLKDVKKRAQQMCQMGTRIYKHYIILDYYPNFLTAVHEKSGCVEAFSYFDLLKYDIHGRYPYNAGHQAYVSTRPDGRHFNTGPRLPMGPKS